MTTSAFELATREGRHPTWEAALLFPDQGKWSESEYLGLDAGRHVEFSGGNVELQPMPDERHQAIVGLLFLLLQQFTSRAGDRVRFAPFPVRLWEEKYREPDLCLMRAANLERCRGSHWEGADLVIEVVSPSNRDLDLVVKPSEYARAGIPEYWIVDPAERRVHVLVLTGGKYVEQALVGDGQTVRSATLAGLEVAATALFDAK